MFFKSISGLVGLLLFVNSCSSHKVYQITNSIPYQNQSINDSLNPEQKMASFIVPYRVQMDSMMNHVLSYSPVDLSKEGYNSTLGKLTCDLVLEESNLIYEKRHQKTIDMCLLNYGGMRRSFTKGNLTVKNIYELMPFENEIVVVTLTEDKILEMVDFLSKAEFGHPISGIKFIPFAPKSIEIDGEKLDTAKTYTIVTTDFLQKGGDQMDFLENPIQIEYLGVKQRDMMLGYFEKHDTLRINLEDRMLR